MPSVGKLGLMPLSEEKKAIDSWDRFVVGHPEGRFCHLSGYRRVVENSYHFKSCYYKLVKNNSIVGIIPLFIMKSIFLGRKIISQPFSEYGGLLLNTLTPEENDEVFDLIKRMMKEAGAGIVEIHGGFGIPEATRDQYLTPVTPHYRAILRLDGDVDTVFNEKIDRMVRKAVRKAERDGIQCFEKSDRDMIINHFYPLFLKSMKRLGVPAHPLSYYLGLFEHLRENIKIYWAEYKDTFIAALLGFTVGRGIHTINMVSDPAYWIHRPNDLCHWRFVKWGIENEYRDFDMGSVRYEGQLKFKRKWGVELQDYHHYLIDVDTMGNNRLWRFFDSSSRVMSFFSMVWRKCVPLWLTKHVGPIVRKQLGR